MKHIRKIIIFIALVISMTCVYNFGTELNKYVEADLENKAVIESASAEEASTIFCSQYRHEEWYEQLGGDASPLADAILDRIVHDSYRINIESISPDTDISMREVYGLAKDIRE